MHAAADRHTDTQTQVTMIGLHLAWSTTHAKCNNSGLDIVWWSKMTVADIVPIIVRLAYVRLMGTLIFQTWGMDDKIDSSGIDIMLTKNLHQIAYCSARPQLYASNQIFAPQSPERSLWYGVQESGRDGGCEISSFPSTLASNAIRVSSKTWTQPPTCSKLRVSIPVCTNLVMFSFDVPLYFLWHFTEKYGNTSSASGTSRKKIKCST